MSRKTRFLSRFIALFTTLVLLIVFNSGFAVIENLEEVSDPLEETSQFFKERDRDVVKPIYTFVEGVRTVIGEARLSHNEAEFLIYMKPAEGWLINEVWAYSGTDSVPVTEEALPDKNQFAFGKNFLTADGAPAGEHLISIDLFTDLGLTWYPEDEEKLLQNVSVYCNAIQTDETKPVEAWVGDEEDTLFVSDDPEFGCWLTYQIKELVYSKNVSKEEELGTDKAKIEVLPYYAPAKRANGDPVELFHRDADGTFETDGDGNPIGRKMVKPLVAVYAEEVIGTEVVVHDVEGKTAIAKSRDVFAAVSFDEGGTWKKTNLSRTADISSFELADGSEYLGDTYKPNIKVQGKNVLIAWTSKYAKSGTPTYSITDTENVNYAEDIWGVGGPQRSRDYTEDGWPGLEIPFSTVWVTRGFVDTDGTMTWLKAERLTSGRRDANQITIAAAGGAGFGLVWQEDPEGLMPGDAAGPGEGWSGATTNQKTDIWYSFIKASDFNTIDTTFESGGDPQYDEDDPLKGDGRPKALIQMSLPVRLSDNDVLNTDSMKMSTSPDVVDENNNPVFALDPLAKEKYGEQIDPSLFYRVHIGDIPALQEAFVPNSESESDQPGSHTYGYELQGLLYRDDGQPDVKSDSEYLHFYKKINNQGVDKYVAITMDGRLLDGDTGASRPNLMLQPYTDANGKTSAYAILGYEETKGTGSGHDGEEGVPNEGEDRYSPDEGKNVIYHTFDYINTEKVSGGAIINPPDKDKKGNPIYLVDAEGNTIYDFMGQPMLSYENARRPRFLVQSKAAALAGKKQGVKGTVMVILYKMGEEGKGRPSDIIMQRWEVNSLSKGNPYDIQYLSKDVQNVSSVTPEITVATSNEEQVKMLRWHQSAGNLNDDTSAYNNDDARAHRGFLRGDFLIIAYTWTPNWTAARNGNDVYNLYIRRSFNGGQTWSTGPDSDGVTHTEIFRDPVTLERYEDQTTYNRNAYEPARNLSLLRNNKESVIEPRVVGTPGTVTSNKKKYPGMVPVTKDGTTYYAYPEDIQDPDSFWVVYGTELNVDTNIGSYDDEEGDEYNATPLDLYYSYSKNNGEDFYTQFKTINEDSEGNNAGDVVEVWDWLAKDHGDYKPAQAEAQIRTSPDGSILYAIWNESGNYPDANGEYKSDAIFRRMTRNHSFVQTVIP